MAFHRNALQLDIWRGELVRAFVWFGLAGARPSENALWYELIVERRFALNTFINR
jgi:hypothetical protein